MRVIVVLLAGLAWTAVALAHGGGSHQGFASRVSVIEPFLPGLLVTVVGGHEQLSVTNLTDKTIVILDGEGQAFVSIAPDATRVWAEPRIGASEDPPEEEGLVRNWRIPGTADGEPFVIRGFLGYRPPPGASGDGGGIPTWATALGAIAGALVLAAALGAAIVRRRS